MVAPEEDQVEEDQEEDQAACVWVGPSSRTRRQRSISRALDGLLESRAAHNAGLTRMRARVHAEMAHVMDTGIRVNPNLSRRV